MGNREEERIREMEMERENDILKILSQICCRCANVCMTA